MDTITIHACRFKRKEKSEWEPGIMVNSDSLILDCKGKPVKAPVWSYHLQMETLALTIQLDTAIVISA